MTCLFPRPCPEFPTYQSLVIKGAYHASAPIHLVLSHTAEAPEARAIFVTPHRGAFKDALVEFNDEYIGLSSGHGSACAAATRTEMFYPPTLAHLRLLLAMLHEYDGAIHHAKTTLEAAPSLLVLHEISTYFSPRSSETTVSAYLSIISSALSLAASWSPRCLRISKLVVFDSGLSELRLPILKPLSFGEEADVTQGHRDTLSTLLERYFEWQAEVQTHDEATEGHEGDHENIQTPLRRSLTLRRCHAPREGESEDVVWRWTEVVEVSDNGRPCTKFYWEDG